MTVSCTAIIHMSVFLKKLNSSNIEIRAYPSCNSLLLWLSQRTQHWAWLQLVLNKCLVSEWTNDGRNIKPVRWNLIPQPANQNQTANGGHFHRDIFQRHVQLIRTQRFFFSISIRRIIQLFFFFHMAPKQHPLQLISKPNGILETPNRMLMWAGVWIIHKGCIFRAMTQSGVAKALVELMGCPWGCKTVPGFPANCSSQGAFNWTTPNTILLHTGPTSDYHVGGRTHSRVLLCLASLFTSFTVHQLTLMAFSCRFVQDFGFPLILWS